MFSSDKRQKVTAARAGRATTRGPIFLGGLFVFFFFGFLTLFSKRWFHSDFVVNYSTPKFVGEIILEHLKRRKNNIVFPFCIGLCQKIYGKLGHNVTLTSASGLVEGPWEVERISDFEVLVFTSRLEPEVVFTVSM